jgi:hypothetical protein
LPRAEFTTEMMPPSTGAAAEVPPTPGVSFPPEMIA